MQVDLLEMEPGAQPEPAQEEKKEKKKSNKKKKGSSSDEEADEEEDEEEKEEKKPQGLKKLTAPPTSKSHVLDNIRKMKAQLQKEGQPLQ